MSTWFHNFQNKTAGCRECKEEFQCHEESTRTLCDSCLDVHYKHFHKKWSEGLPKAPESTEPTRVGRVEGANAQNQKEEQK